MDEMTLLPLLAAPFMGSFAGVLITRLPHGRPVIYARSACDSCGSGLSAHELLPLFSYACQRGRCRTCRAPIGFFHPAVELAAITVAAIALVATGALSGVPDMARLWGGCVLGWALLALGWIDLRTLRLPDALTLPLVLAGLVECDLINPTALGNHAIGAGIGYAAFRLIAGAYRYIRGREGLGQGDAKLLAAAGAWIGYEQLPLVIAGGSIVTLLAIGILQLTRPVTHMPDDAWPARIPFGPGLALALWVLFLFGPAPWGTS